MKKQIILSSVVVALAFLLCFCKKDPSPITGGLPDKIVVDIPEAISSSSQLKSSKEDGCIPVSGDSIYQNVRMFIAMGKFSATFVEDVVKAIKVYGLDKPMDFTFASNEDQKQKHLVVVENGSFNGKTYQMKLTTTDVESGKTAMQIFWNKDRIEGVAIVRPRYLNTIDSSVENQPNLMYQVEYTSVSTGSYDQKMIVSISGFELTSNQFSVNNMKLEASKKGNIVTVIGNSNHPNAIFIDPSKKGFSYAFVAKGDQSNNIGVIKLGLPPVTLDNSDVLTTYSVSEVIKAELNYYITKAGLDPNVEPFKTCVSNVLVNCQTPAYYGSNGYISSGAQKPTSGNYDEVSSLDALSPFSPKEINSMALTFAE